MKIVIAPNAFKESLSAPDVAQAIKRGVLKADSKAQCQLIPLADGGDGTTDALVAAQAGKYQHITVKDPLGRPVEARYGLIQQGKTAVIEMAQASGLWRMQESEKNPMNTSTVGTGEMLMDAINRGVNSIVIGIGGSATNDGGMGMAVAMGYRFLDENGEELNPCGASLNKIMHIDDKDVGPDIFKCDIGVACDVTNPLTGKEGAAAVYGPQKGATSEQVIRLDDGLKNLNHCWKDAFGIDCDNMPGAGAAGGLGAGLHVFAKAKLRSGFELVAEYAGLDDALSGADLVITGEGKLDESTLYGKVPSGVAKAAKSKGIAVVALTGTINGCYGALQESGFDSVFSIVPGPVSLQEAMQNTAAYLENTSEQVIRLWQIKN